MWGSSWARRACLTSRARGLQRRPVPQGAVSEGLVRRYGGRAKSREVLGRLEFELQTIEKMGFADYFLIVWDFVKYAKDRKIAVGPGRGSAAGSIVAYALEITDLDPLEYSLLFERFLDPDRINMPDVDIDFSVSGRSEVMRCARASTAATST